jgi:hypothetical protein
MLPYPGRLLTILMYDIQPVEATLIDLFTIWTFLRSFHFQSIIQNYTDARHVLCLICGAQLWYSAAISCVYLISMNWAYILVSWINDSIIAASSFWTGCCIVSHHSTSKTSTFCPWIVEIVVIFGSWGVDERYCIFSMYIILLSFCYPISQEMEDTCQDSRGNRLSWFCYCWIHCDVHAHNTHLFVSSTAFPNKQGISQGCETVSTQIHNQWKYTDESMNAICNRTWRSVDGVK